MIKKIINNDYSISVFTKILTMFVGVLSTSFLTRYLGIDNKGNYAFINQVVTVSGLILNLGIYQSYTYFYKIKGNLILPKYISMSFVQFIIYLLLGFIISFFCNNLTVTLICITIPFYVIRTQMDNIMLVQNIKIRLQTTRLSSLITLSAYTILFFLLLMNIINSNIVYVIITTIMIDACIVVRYIIKERIRIKICKADINFTKEVLKFGFLPMISALLVTLNYSIDIFFLKKMGTQSDLSLYSVAAGIMNYVWLVPDAFKDVLYSRVIKESNESSIAFSTKFSLLFLIITTIGFLIFGRLFIQILYGEDFISSYSITLILFLGVYSMVFFKIFGIVMLAEGRRVPFFIILLVSVILNIVLNYLFIPNYGMYGAAYASVGSYNLCGIIFLIYFSRASGIPIKKFILINKEEIQNMKLIFSQVKKK